MITVTEAAEIIKNNLPNFGETIINLDQLKAGILTEAIAADRAYPPAHRVMMDGILISWLTYQQGCRKFKILGTVAAGEPPLPLTDPQGCYEIMTGAVLTDTEDLGDLVIPYEAVEIKEGYAHIIEEQERSQFENIHLKGSDCPQNQLIIEPNLRLNGARWGIVASMGKTEVKCLKKPRINIISTGDELVEVKQIPQSYQVRRSNIYALKASLKQHNFEEIFLTHLNDDQEAIINHYQKATLEYDILIYSGGVSKGKFDYLPSIWEKLGVTKYIHGVAQRPGKPLWFGVDHHHKTVIFGLPGNPISSLVCLHRYLIETPPIYAQLTEDFTFKKDLTYFLPVKLNYTPLGIIKAEPIAVKNSGEFIALANSDGFLELPQFQSYFKAGQSFPFYAW